MGSATAAEVRSARATAETLWRTRAASRTSRTAPTTSGPGTSSAYSRSDVPTADTWSTIRTGGETPAFHQVDSNGGSPTERGSPRRSMVSGSATTTRGGCAGTPKPSTRPAHQRSRVSPATSQARSYRIDSPIVGRPSSAESMIAYGTSSAPAAATRPMSGRGARRWMASSAVAAAAARTRTSSGGLARNAAADAAPTRTPLRIERPPTRMCRSPVPVRMTSGPARMSPVISPGCAQRSARNAKAAQAIATNRTSWRRAASAVGSGPASEGRVLRQATRPSTRRWKAPHDTRKQAAAIACASTTAPSGEGSRSACGPARRSVQSGGQ